MIVKGWTEIFNSKLSVLIEAIAFYLQPIQLLLSASFFYKFSQHVLTGT